MANELGIKRTVVMDADKGQPGGVATLGDNGRLTPAQAPTAADIPTANGSTVGADLSNKANWLGGALQQGSVKSWALSAGAGRTIAAEATCTGTPYPAYWLLETAVANAGGWMRLDATNILTGDQQYCLYNSGLWGPWTPIATATKPQEYDLPLAAGYVKADQHMCSYSKAQDGTVLVHIAINHTSGTLPIGSCIAATLPVGYRPSGYVGRSINATDMIRIPPDGRVIYALSTAYALLVDTLEFRTT